jgi:hypothetical protein
MNVHYVCKGCLVAVLLALGANLGLQKAISVPPAPTDVTQAAQVLTRGPVHEAFAETVSFNPAPGIIAPKAPPAAIEELPPDQRLQGANVAWIPGYWAWDDERSDYLWVSGIWRDLPPGRQWVPGYWGQSGTGSQWTSGYWADAQVSEVQYLPAPPATAEVGPNIAAPAPDDTWLPGNWMWRQNRYAWRPGIWAAAQPDWNWVPAHYIWAPRGYVFVDGYWDYAIGRRGVLFAPVYFPPGSYAQPGFSYSPSMAIDLGALTTSLFLRPNYYHYYFGDYYAANYQAAGFYPSYSCNSGRLGYDPIFAHDRWQHRASGQWEQAVAADFMNRRDHENARPPRTWAAQTAMSGGRVASPGQASGLAVPFSQLVKSQNSPLRFQPVTQLERQKLGQYGQSVERYRDARQRLETRVATPLTGQPASRLAPATVKLPTSPIVARPTAELDRNHVPPQMHVAPAPDSHVEARPRATPSPAQSRERTVNRLPLDTPQPKVERPAPQPKPKAEQPAPQPQPKVERPAPQPQPKVEHPAPQPQPKVERPAPQPKPKAERPAPQPPASRPAAGPKQEKDKDK